MWTFQPRAPLYHNIIMFISIESMSLCIFCAALESQGTQTQVNRSFQVLSLGFKVNPTVNDLELFCFGGRRANQTFLLRKTRRQTDSLLSFC